MLCITKKIRVHELFKLGCFREYREPTKIFNSLAFHMHLIDNIRNGNLKTP